MKRTILVENTASPSNPKLQFGTLSAPDPHQNCTRNEERKGDLNSLNTNKGFGNDTSGERSGRLHATTFSMGFEAFRSLFLGILPSSWG
jgi:hypothetical protein